MEITNIEELKRIASGQVVEIIGFKGTEDDYFIAKLKRPSLLNLVGMGTIPNELLSAADRIFNGANPNKKYEVSMKESFDLYTIIAKAALVEPTYEELEVIGLELTDEQLIDIFNYTQRGMKGLISFRTKQEYLKNYKSK